MKHSGLFVMVFSVLLALLGACSGEPESPLSRKQTGVRNVPDPAMERMHAVENRAVAADAGEQPEQQTPLPAPDSFTVDVENKRVFLPGKGWLEAAAFWDIYYNHPEELPGDINHAAIEPLRLNGAGDNHPAQ